MNYAPIVMFAYNRADHFNKTFQALSRCPEATESELFIFSDGPKNEMAVDQVMAVREAIHAVEKDNLFKRVIIFESSTNKGLATSIITGVTSVINQYGHAIVLEDDCVASPYLLSFMNRCLDYFENDHSIGSISGYVPTIKFPTMYDADIFLARRSCSWSWATWKNRWDGVDWNLEHIDEFYRNIQLISELNSNGTDRFIRLYRQTKGNGSSWSVRFGAHHILKGYFVIYPRYSYIQNVGCDASGVHSKTDDADKAKVDLIKAIADPRIVRPELNMKIQKKMRRFYSGGFISDGKRFFATLWIVVKTKLKYNISKKDKRETYGL